MKRIVSYKALIISIFMLSQLIGCSTKVMEPVYEGDKVIHIGAWVGPRTINNDTYKDVADSGINCIYGLYEGKADALKALDLAQANGIKYLVRDWSASGVQEDDFDQLDTMFDSYKNHPAFAGVLMYDEPGPIQFDRLGKIHEIYKKILPGKLFYINLFPTYSSVAQRNGVDYKEYINQYIEKVKPEFVSYDYYPLMKNVEGNALKEDFLYNLEVVSNASKKANIPFWTFIQAMSFTSAGMTNRDVTEADIRFQVFCDLAFGAKGIQYFCYWTPTNDGLAVFGDAMIDKDGKKTPTYDAVKNVNKELTAIDNYYLNYENKGVMLFPKDNLPNTMYMENPLTEFKPIRDLKSEQPVVMGCFEDKSGNKAIVLVNYTDPSSNLSNKVTISFNNVRELSVFNKEIKSRVVLNSGKYEVTLQPGEGKFIQLLK